MRAATAIQPLADKPDYLPPCPMCSYLDHPETGRDLIRGPFIFSPRNQGATPGYCCPFSERLWEFRRTSAERIAAEWRGLLMGALAAEAPGYQRSLDKAGQPVGPSHGKLWNTMGRLARKGYLPSVFLGEETLKD